MDLTSPLSHQDFLGGVSAAIVIVMMSVYIRSIIVGQTRPHIFTWLVWWLLGAIAFSAQIIGGAGAGAWTLGTYLVLETAILFLALKKGDRNFSRSDKIFLGLSLAAFVPWAIAHDPLWSVIMSCLVNIAAFVPTYTKTWKDPYSENLSSFFATAIAMIISCGAMETFSPTTLLYPSTMAGSNIAFVAMALYRRTAVRKSA